VAVFSDKINMIISTTTIFLALFVIVVICIKISKRKGVKNMKISYKLVFEKEGAVHEEPFENFEAMLERVKVLEAEAVAPVEPAVSAEPAAVVPAGETTPPAGEVLPAA